MSKNTNSGILKLPPGFRFHPSDEEIITFYLRPKVLDSGFTAHAIGEADINRSEPWELPEMAKMGEKEWYFYCLKGRKYPSGFRANRATKAGYWKATGKDKEIYRATSKKPMLVGMKKTLVFYKGRAPTGDKTDWVMHEFRLDGSGRLPCPTVKSSSSTINAITSSSKIELFLKEEWVICRLYHKSSGIKKVQSPSFDTTTATGDVEQRSMSFPLPMQFPIGSENFAVDSNTLNPIMDPSMSFYSTTGVSSSLSPALLPMPDIGNSELQMDTTYFSNPIVTTQSISLYQPLRIGPTDGGGLMAELNNRPTSIFLQDPRINSYQTNTIDISSMVSTELPPVAAIDTGDSMWKF